ncbi:MAG: M48 family metallopeptidase [Candidatus Aenigmatarchaeota archaeon]
MPEAAAIMLFFAGVFILVDIFVSYNYGDKIVLKSVNAKPADEVKNRHLIDTVEGLAIAAGIPKPNIYITESKEINAFACGKDPKHASICVTTGLLENLKRDEIEGVIGHEMSHIRNYDIRFATLIAVLVGLAAIVSSMFLRSFRYGNFGGNDNKKSGAIIIVMLVIAVILAIIAPIVTRIVQAAVSRKREYLADASGAELTRYPEGLASALEKIKNVNEGKMKVSEAVSHLFISDPNKSALDSLFATHPPIDKRIKLLREM